MKNDSVGVTTNTLHPAEVLTKGCEQTVGGREEKGKGGRWRGGGGVKGTVADGQERKVFSTADLYESFARDGVDIVNMSTFTLGNKRVSLVIQ